jgi:DNA repair photolyase
MENRHPATWKTSKGQPVTWFVEQQLAQGRWQEQIIGPELTGLSRPITVFRAPKTSDLIAYDWHGDKQTFCPPMWWDLAIGSGACNLGCRSCFLVLTHRIRRDPWRHLLYSNIDDFTHAAEKWLAAPQRRHQHTLGVGIDRSDSLLYEGVTGHVRNLAPLFASPRSNRVGNKLILLTKSANTRYLEEIAPPHRSQVVVSFSLNPQSIADCWEGLWPDGQRIPPTIAHRLGAARHAQDLGFEVRIRVDPILTPDGWQEAYQEFFAEIAACGIHFAYYTLGSYREKNPQLQAWTQHWGMQPMTWQPHAGDMVQDGTHRHLSEGKRVEMYQVIRDSIRRVSPMAKVSLCKETHRVRKLVGLCNADCNCLL